MEDEAPSIPESVRIGSVSYLNAKPLVFGLGEDVLFRHPSSLAEDFFNERIDVALLPIFSVLGRTDIAVVDGVAIASLGAVYSVILASRTDVIRKIHLDPASRTSVHLLKVICRRFLQIDPEFCSEDSEDCDARLLIGDQAIRFRQTQGAEWRIADLGEMWTRFTGLPFVYAVWAIRENVPNARDIAEKLRETGKRGLESLSKIIETLPEDQRDFAREYLNGYIRYSLGDQEKEAIRRFAGYLRDLKLLGSEQELRYLGSGRAACMPIFPARAASRFCLNGTVSTSRLPSRGCVQKKRAR